MIQLKSVNEIAEMKKSGQLLARAHQHIKSMIRPGTTTWEIEEFVNDFLEKNGAIPEEKGFEGYQFATCASVNDEICHGFPNKKPLKKGDIVTIDMVVNLNGAMSDSAWSYAVGEISDEAQHLLETTEKSLYKGIEQAVVGNRLGDIGYAIQSYAEAEGLSVVREFVGHGIGPTMHEDPPVAHYGRPGRGLRLREGMTITIEPMLNTGDWHAKVDSNGWTARTVDGSLSAQYEHTLAITKNGPEILTSLDEA
ncbi:type I methionyl aminopeptidase [Sporolactobacillus terrae]|uniref:Methionine aminopeptidase n=1 Tax=Sporolactobacillus terrae TaxID=269673 RepID=A0ABX5QAD6_9BACL|nr:type I methionyl aminopeptidase [Sporolactobacillus terrae]QAA23547.1 type I methionyl aminopeptidase [Sporolactobacillus terrae]QAA26517.1 type I methionyl aminopeptidase [Sporolactobacillus terrae]UAK15593.1 type I methionyl aminopeptidase [Sporolactobacillus terrae]